VNPDVDPHTHAYIATGSHENKFGIALDQIGAVYARAAGMAHPCRRRADAHRIQITEAQPFANAIEKVAPLLRELKSKYGIKFFSIGGGMALFTGGRWRADQANGGTTTAANLPRSASPITRMRLCRRYVTWVFRFCLNPVASCRERGVLLTRVHYIKQTGSKKFAIVDAA